MFQFFIVSDPDIRLTFVAFRISLYTEDLEQWAIQEDCYSDFMTLSK